MADGSYARIDSIRVGDRVWASDPHYGEPETQRVERLWKHREAGQLYEVSTRHGSVRATGAHPFWSASASDWVDAAELEAGDELQTRDGSRPLVTSVKAGDSRNQYVHNLTVQGTHTYFVAFGETAVLVHNCSVVTKASSPIWGGMKSHRGITKTNGKSGKKREFYEWDHTHNDIEVYDGQGRHKGSMDPVSGLMIKPPVPGRKIKL